MSIKKVALFLLAFNFVTQPMIVYGILSVNTEKKYSKAAIAAFNRIWNDAIRCKEMMINTIFGSREEFHEDVFKCAVWTISIPLTVLMAHAWVDSKHYFRNYFAGKMDSNYQVKCPFLGLFKFRLKK